MSSSVSQPAKVLNASELQALLTARQDEFDRAMSNLGDLMSNTTYKLLTDSQVFANLVGVSRDKIVPALSTLSEIWGLVPQVSDLLTRAAEMHKNLPRFFQEKELAQIQEMLCGQAVQVKQEIPFAQRSLLDPTTKVTSFSIEQVLALVGPVYVAARDLVLEVEKIFKALFDQVGQHDATVKQIEADCTELDATLLPQVETLKQRVTTLRSKVSTDPLGAQAEFAGDLLPEVTALNQKLGEMKRLKLETDTQVRAARVQLTALKSTYENARAAQDERILKVSGIATDTIPRLFAEAVFTDSARGLEPWLARLEKNLAEGKWRAVSMGIANWTVQLQERQEQATAVLNANLAPVNLRRELRGRLDALKAKATQLKVVEEPKLSQLSGEAEALLYNRPTDLKRAEALVQQYAAAIISGDWE